MLRVGVELDMGEKNASAKPGVIMAFRNFKPAALLHTLKNGQNSHNADADILF